MNLNEITAVIVNNDKVSLRELIVWAWLNDSLPVLNEKTEQALVSQGAAEMGIGISDDELQQKSDEFRTERRMYRAAETMKWLAGAGVSLKEYEDFLKFHLLRDKIKDSFSEDKIELYFRLSMNFDTAVISQIVTENEEKAAELLTILKDGYKEFHTLARYYSIEEEGKRTGGYLGKVKRLSLSPEVAVEVFGSREGDIVGPIKTDQGYHIIKIDELKPPRLDEETKGKIKESLYRKWLKERLEKSHVEEKIWEII